MTTKSLVACALLLVSFSSNCRAEDNLFSTSADAPKLLLTLKGPWSKIARDKSEEPKPSAVVLSLPGTAPLEIKVKPRGKSRRDKDFCRFPPLWLDFPKNKLENTAFAGQNKIKLVTHCSRLGPSSGRANDRLWSEYLAYRMYNLVTDTSFRVRAVDIRYVDLGDQELGQHPGFLIEHKHSAAKRLQLTPVTSAKVSISSLRPEVSALVSLFEYFIGGVDYSQIRGPEEGKCCHNLTAMTAADGLVVGLPYDFDATGFVDPPYGQPAPSLKLTSYSERLYRGFCRVKQGHQSALNKFLVTRSQFEQLIQDFPDISTARRKKLLRYIKGFYKRLPNQAKGIAWLEKNCRQW